MNLRRRGDCRGACPGEYWVGFLTSPDAVLVSQPLASRLGLRVGDHLPVLVGPARKSLTVRGIFRSESGLYPLDGAVLLMDVAAAQELLDRVGLLDYIDLLTTGTGARLPGWLKKELPAGVEAVRPGALESRTQGLMAAYRLNLEILSAIALFVGMFLIYQSVTLSVVRRRREIGLLRTLGVTPGQVLRLFLAEGLVSGLAGGALGLILGIGLARGVLALMTRNLTSLYTPVVAAEVGPALGTAAPGLGAGAGRHPWRPRGSRLARRPAPKSGPFGSGRSSKRESTAGQAGSFSGGSPP